VYLNRARRLCFLANPRTGSESVANALEHAGWEKVREHHTTPAETPSIDLTGRIAGKSWSVATAVRSHWDTFPSWLHFHWPERAEPFTPELLREVVDATTWISETSLFGLMLPYATVVLRYEALDDDLATWLGHPLPLPARLGVSRHRRPTSFYWSNPAAVRWVTERYGYELREWGYPLVPPT
jgi:hypothetical protein